MIKAGEVGGVQMVELADVIVELRRELERARATVDPDEALRFELGPVELEATVAVEKVGGVGAKVRFWVIELGGDAQMTHSSTQRVKLTLQPRLAGSDDPPWVSGEEVGRER
jgi:hypothetical protein